MELFIFQGKINLPPRWEKIPAGKTMVAVQVKAGSEEFTRVEKNLKSSAGGAVNSVVKVCIFIVTYTLFVLLAKLLIH